MFDLVVDDADGLADFRRQWLSPATMLSALEQQSVILTNVPVGVGKSRLLDDMLDELRLQPQFDVIIVLVELTAGLLERRLVQRMPDDVRRLRPRPRDVCGTLDQTWRGLEELGCAAYAKKHVCGSCPHYELCFWPGQYGKALKGASVVFGTHSQLKVNPFFVQHIQMITGAEKTLLVLDEAGFIETSSRVALGRRKLSDLVAAIGRADVREDAADEWAYQVILLTHATTQDLRRSDWKLPFLSPDEIVSIQEAGLTVDPRFRWVGHKVQALTRASLTQRWTDGSGIHFVSRPYLADRTLILSADMDEGYVQRQICVARVHNPIPPARIHHRGTRFYNICCLHGAARRFRGNHKQILDIFGQLILRNIDADRLTLLITRKHLKALCIEYLTQRLIQWGRPIHLVASGGAPIEQPSPVVIPVIHYGICGINSFEDYYAAYCLNSFYLDENVLRQAVADVEDDDLRFPVRIEVRGTPKRRVAATFDKRFRASDADSICQAYYRQLETNTVIQAVGRVRYATRPREVITFQAADLHNIPLHREFYSLRELREYFGLATGSEFTRNLQRSEAKRLRREGGTTGQIAERLGISQRTVRYRLASSKEAER